MNKIILYISEKKESIYNMIYSFFVIGANRVKTRNNIWLLINYIKNNDSKPNMESIIHLLGLYSEKEIEQFFSVFDNNGDWILNKLLSDLQLNL